MAGTIGLVQNDIKRVLAYSTVSQLGYMFLAMGVGAFGAGIFHLYTHAFFKALLFLGSGAVIHALHGEQDIRNMGGLKKHLPITYWTFVIGSLAIAGVPLLAGFFCKDEILFETFAGGISSVGGRRPHVAADRDLHVPPRVPDVPRRRALRAQGAHDASGASRTATAAHGHGAMAHGARPWRHLHDAPPAMAMALVVLAIGSVLAGYIGVPHALGGTTAWRLARAGVPGADCEPVAATGRSGRPRMQPRAEGEAAEREPARRSSVTLMGVSSAIALGGIGLALTFFLVKRREIADRHGAQLRGLHRLLLNKYYVDEVYDADDRPAHQGRLERRAVARRRRQGDRRRGQRRRPMSVGGAERGAAPCCRPARCKSLCGVDVPRRRSSMLGYYFWR